MAEKEINIAETKEKFMSLVGGDEMLCAYPGSVFNAGAVMYHFIVPCDVSIMRMDILGLVEETLHKLLDEGFTDEEIGYILGARKMDESDEEPREDEWAYVDLDYYIPTMWMMPGAFMLTDRML